MRPNNPLIFEQVISKPRLDSYKGYFHASTEEAVGLYMWNCRISACLSTLISYFEVALRNRIHWSMSDFYSRGANQSIHWYDSIRGQLKPETQRTITKIRSIRGAGGVFITRNPAPSPDEIVSRVTFGFWPSILGVVDRRYADRLLPGIFPNHPLNATPSAWTINATRKSALAFIYELNEMRNRIAHHEPLWKFSAIKDTSVTPAVVIAAASTNQAESVARFHRLLALLDANLSAVNMDLGQDLSKSRWRSELNFLLTSKGVERYKNLRHVPEEASMSPADLRRQFSLVGKGNQPVNIGTRSRFAGVFIPD
jgi:hypothetical protein